MRLLFCLLMISGYHYSCAQEPVNSNEREIVFHSVNVIPMDKEEVLQNQVVVVKSGIIRSIGSPSSVKYSNEALVIDGKGKYLIPGLAEMHAHVPPVDDLEPMKNVLLLFATHGITTIRGMLGHPRHLELRSKINSGAILGPKFYTSGPSLNGQTVQTPAAADSVVRAQKKAGYDFMKIHPGLTLKNFEAVARASRQQGIPFAGHVSFHVGVWRAIDAGYQTIDHMDAFVEGLVPGMENISEEETGLFALWLADRADTTQIPRLVKALREKKVWVVPTQALAERWFTPARTAESFQSEPAMKYMSDKTLNNWVNAKTSLRENPRFDSLKIDRLIRLRRKLIYDCYKGGVGMLLGCDAPQVFNVPGISTHQELQYLVDAGLTPYEALRTGTVNVASFYNKAGKSGVVRKGAVADLILLTANPLLDIANSQKIEGVMLGNKWLSADFISSTLNRLEKNVSQ